MTRFTADSILGCIVGGAVGDAWGSAFEGTAATTKNNVLGSRDWQISDDTQQTLATCEAIVESGKVEPERIAAAMLSWFRQGRLTGLGSSTLKALRDLDAGAHWALSGSTGEQSAGNGAAMRIAPLAFVLDPEDEQSRVVIRDVCRITHRHDEAYAAALAVLFAIRGWSLLQVAPRLPDTRTRDRLSELAGTRDETFSHVAARIGTSGYAAESIPLALFAAERAKTIGFTEMLAQLIALGGDTDTNASIAGQVAGMTVGFAALPIELVDRLPEKQWIVSLAQAFADFIVHRG